MGRVPIAEGWVRDEEENILMKCIWQRAYRGLDGAEVLRMVWLCEGKEGFSVRVEEVDAEERQRILWHTKPVQEEKLMDAIREAIHIVRVLPHIASSLLSWTPAGTRSFDLRIGAVELYGYLGERCEAPRVSFVIQPIKLVLDLDDLEAVEALAQALGI
jgi:hypothetical protein